MKKLNYKFRSKLWRYKGKAAWHFLSVPVALSKEIKTNFSSDSAAWGSIRILANINGMEWKTSLFPDSKRACYLIPIKKSIRKLSDITESENVNIKFKIILADFED